MKKIVKHVFKSYANVEALGKSSAGMHDLAR